MAAVYVALGLIFLPISFGIVQFRVAEALMPLCAVLPGAVPGVVLGCFIANIGGALGLVDLIGGTLATAIAAVVTAWIGRRSGLGSADSDWRGRFELPLLLVPLPSVVANALIVGSYLPFLLLEPPIGPAIWLSSVASVGLGELGSVYLLGLPLLMALGRAGLIAWRRPRRARDTQLETEE